MAVAIGVGLELLGIAREDAWRWSSHGLFETHCKPNAYCRAIASAVAVVMVLAGAILLHRTAKSRTVKVLDIVAGGLVILLFAGFVYSRYFA